MQILKKILSVLILATIVFIKPAYAYDMQSIEDSIYSHLENWDTSFSVPYYENNALEIIKKAAKRDDYLSLSLSYLSYRIAGNSSTANITYRTTKEQEAYIDYQLESIVNSIILPEMSDFDKVKTINKYLEDRYNYDYSLKSDNAYSALTTGKTTCQGYAMTAYKMFKLAGLENKIVVGTLDGTPHGWNLVKVDGEWYHIDITNNDQEVKDKYFLEDDDYLRTKGFSWNSADYTEVDFSYEDSLTGSHSKGYWYQKEGSWYFMQNAGYNATRWHYINKHWYYLGQDGKMQTGWIYDKGNWYFCWSNGIMATNTTVYGYTLNENGAWVS